METGTPVHLETISAISSAVTSSESSEPSAWSSSRWILLGSEVLLELDQLAVADLGRALEVALALGALELGAAALLALLLDLAHVGDRLLFSFSQRAFMARAPWSRRFGDLVAAPSSRSFAGGVALLLAAPRCLDLELDAPALDLVELLGHRVDLYAHPAGRLVDEVDGLVRQEAVGDVAVRQRRRGDDRRVLDAHAVVHLVALLQAAQDRDRVLAPTARRRSTGWKRRSRAASFSMCLRYSSRVVAPMQRSSPRASAGFSMLAASTAPSAAPAPTSVCSSSMKRMIWPSASISLRTAFSRSSNSPRYLVPAISAPRSSGHEPLVLQGSGHVAVGDALGEALGDRGLADAGVADQHRVVLGAAREHLHDAADLLVAADHGVDLALSGGVGEVAAELLEGLVLRLGVLVGHARAAAHRGQGLQQGLALGAALAQQRVRRRSSLEEAIASSRCSVETYSSLRAVGLA